jgi:hypothetical protein
MRHIEFYAVVLQIHYFYYFLLENVLLHSWITQSVSYLV